MAMELREPCGALGMSVTSCGASWLGDRCPCASVARLRRAAARDPCRIAMARSRAGAAAGAVRWERECSIEAQVTIHRSMCGHPSA